MLETLHKHLRRGVAIYGMHRGSVGFLMNGYSPDGLEERIADARPVRVNPLAMSARDQHGTEHHALAIQRGLAAAPEPPDREAAGQRRRRSCSSTS